MLLLCCSCRLTLETAPNNHPENPLREAIVLLLCVDHPAAISLSICVVLNGPKVVIIRSRIVHVNVWRYDVWVSAHELRPRKEPNVLEHGQTCDILLREPTVELVPFFVLEHVGLLVAQDVAVDQIGNVDVLRLGVERVRAEINREVHEQWSEQASTSILLLLPSHQHGAFLGEHLHEKVSRVCKNGGHRYSSFRGPDLILRP